MRKCLCFILFLVLSLTIPAMSVHAHSGGGGGSSGSDGAGGSGGDSMIGIENTSSDTENPPSGFEPTAPESADSEITTSSETDPGKEEELAELVEEVNTLDETAEEEDVEGDSTDSADETTPDDDEETAELDEEGNPLEETADEGDVEDDVEDDSTDSAEDTNPDSEEEATESDEDTNPQEETAEEGDVEGDSTDSAEETTPDNEEETAESGEGTNLQEETADEGDVGDNSEEAAEGTTPDKKNPDESTPTEDQGDKKTEVATLVEDIDPNGSADESKTTEQPDPDPGLIGTPGTLPGTRGATLDKITEPEINEDGSVSTWAIYSNDTWVETTVNPDGTHEVAVVLDSGTVIRPGREYIHTGGSLNPALDAIITALEVTAAAGTVAGWVLTVTPAGALASGGVKATAAVWGATTGIQAVRAGADAYAENINEGASQGEAIYEGAKQTTVNAAVVTGVGKYLGTPYEKGLGSLASSKTGKVAVEIAVKNYGNFAADGTTGNLTGYNPGYKPY